MPSLDTRHVAHLRSVTADLTDDDLAELGERLDAAARPHGDRPRPRSIRPPGVGVLRLQRAPRR
jgi:hypothetical protein